MIAKLFSETVQQIEASKRRVVAITARFGMRIATVSRHRPTKRKHLTDAEHDQIIAEWVAHIRPTDRVESLGVSISTIQNCRRRAMAALCKEKSNRTA